MLKRTTLLPLILAAALTGCGNDSPENSVDYTPEGTKSYGGVYVSASIGEPSNLIPWLAGDAASSEVTAHIYNSLIKYDKNLEFEADLAQSWDVSEDGLTLTFHLQPDAKWSDGTPFTAHDVMATYKTITDPNTRTPYAQKYTIVKEAKVLDDHTFRVTYAEPFAPALASWAQLAILPKHKLDEAEDINTAELVQAPLGTGPYKLQKWKRGQEIQLIANPDSFEGRPNITLLRNRLITDLDAQFLALRKGEIDNMGLKPIQYERLTNKDSFTDRFAKYRYMGRLYVYMGFNLKHDLFKDKHVRQALSFATPRETIINGILMGHGVASFGPFVPETWAENPNLKPYPQDFAKAKELLANAGWKDTDGDGILDKDGKPFQFTVVTNQGNDQRIKTAEIMQQAFKKVGVDMKIRVQEWATFIENTIHKRDFDAVMLGWSLPVEPDPYDVWHSSKTGPREFNFVGYNNPRVDELITKARQTFDQAERQKYLWEFQEILHDEQPYLFLFSPNSLVAIHRRVKGVEPAPAGIGYNFEDWYIPESQRLYNADMIVQ